MNYLYNDVELPMLPEWDKKKYPYGFICIPHSNSDIIAFKVVSSIEYYNPNMGLVVKNPSKEYELRNGEWVYTGGYNTDISMTIPYQIYVWTNTDIYNKDGTLYLAASEPVLVSTYTPNPTAITIGMLMGQTVRRMRK